MPTFTESDVLNAVSKALGSPPESEYSTADKQDALRRGLIQYSQFRPLRKIGSFETEANTQIYDIGSSYSYLIGITDVFYGPSDSPDLEYMYNAVQSDYINTAASGNLNTINHEALRVMDERALSLLQSSKRYDFEPLDDNNVALIPTPTSVQTIFFTYTIIRTLDDLRENDYQDIVDFTFMIAGSSLLSERSKRPLQMNVPDIGFIMFQSNKNIEKQLEETSKRLTGKFGVTSFVTHG
jgi:hypothetical protein